MCFHDVSLFSQRFVNCFSMCFSIASIMFYWFVKVFHGFSIVFHVCLNVCNYFHSFFNVFFISVHCFLSGFHYFHGCFQCVSSFFIDSFNVFSPFFIFSMFLHVLHQFSFVLNMC